MKARRVITSLTKGSYVFGSVGLSVCLFVCGHCSKTYEWIWMKFYVGVWFGGDLSLLR